MTLIEQAINDIEYDGMELEINIWRDGEMQTVSLEWDGDRYTIK